MGNLLDLVKNIADKDVIKDVLPKGPDGLKQLRDIEGAVSSAAGQAQQAMQQIMQQAGAALGGLQSVMSQLQSILNSAGASQAAPTIPTGSFAATHEEAAEATDQAITDLTTMINALQTLSNCLEAIDTYTAPISAFSNHENFLARMDVISDAYLTLADYDLSVLGVVEINSLLLGMRKVMEILAAVPEVFIVDYNLSKMVYASPKIVSDLDFYGIDIADIVTEAEALIAAFRAASATRLGTGYVEEFSYAATILEDKLNQEWTLTDNELCVADAVHHYYPLFLAMLRDGDPSYLELTDLIKKMMDAIAACSATKLLGAPMGQSSAIPQIGSMIDSTLSDFISKGINDQEKVKKAIEKFTKKQHIVEKKRQIVKGEMTKPDSSAKEATPTPAPPPDISQSLDVMDVDQAVSGEYGKLLGGFF